MRSGVIQDGHSLLRSLRTLMFGLTALAFATSEARANDLWDEVDCTGHAMAGEDDEVDCVWRVSIKVWKQVPRTNPDGSTTMVWTSWWDEQHYDQFPLSPTFRDPPPPEDPDAEPGGPIDAGYVGPPPPPRPIYVDHQGSVTKAI